MGERAVRTRREPLGAHRCIGLIASLALELRNTRHATWFSPSLRRLQEEQSQSRPTVFHETRNTKHETRDTKHETRITAVFFFRNTAFSVVRMVLVGTEALQSFFFSLNLIRVESDDAVAGTENLIRARRGRAGWGRRSRLSNFFSGIYETRNPRHGVSWARGASQREFQGFHESRITRHETRLFSDPKHGFSVARMVLVGTEALQSFFSDRAGIA